MSTTTDTAQAHAHTHEQSARALVKPGNEVVSVQHLTKTFRDFWMRSRVRAVDDVSFDIYRGEVFGLLGPNGSGKSTSIKIILGLLHKSFGRVTVFGKLPTDVAVKRRIGYLPEESYLYPFLNARETLDYYGKLFELDSDVRKRRIDELLDMVGLSAVQFRPVREYSKGMQRRIGIAQALINDPELLILDEPTTGLDPIGTRQIKDLILELARRGKTVLLSSHLLGDVEDCVDRLVILYGGKIQASGTCAELLESADRSIIETEKLDDATIARIDEIIRQRTGGQSAIARVSHPRQRLEDLFIQIVERARDARIATAGAQHGGQTAAFLRDQPEGRAVIDELLTAEPASPAPTPSTRPAPMPRQVDQSVLADLLGKGGPSAAASDSGKTEPAKVGTNKNDAGTSTPKPAPKPAQAVDQSVIGSLLDGGSPDKNAPAKKPGPGPGPGGRA